MPCFTLVQVEVRNKEMAEQALKQMGVEADITRNSNGTYTVTPKNQQSSFRDKFLSIRRLWLRRRPKPMGITSPVRRLTGRLS